MKLVIGLLVYFMGAFSFAENETVVNQVIFSDTQQSWTSRDRALFNKVMDTLVQRRLSQYTENLEEDFLLSRLSYYEAILFEITPTKIKISELAKKKFSEYTHAELQSELEKVESALALIDLKEAQFKQKLRFKTWFDLLKRKYQVKIKSAG